MFASKIDLPFSGSFLQEKVDFLQDGQHSLAKRGCPYPHGHAGVPIAFPANTSTVTQRSHSPNTSAEQHTGRHPALLLLLVQVLLFIFLLQELPNQTTAPSWMPAASQR